MIEKVSDGLLVGDASSVLDETRLQRFTDLQITHVLTVAAAGIPEEKRVPGVRYMFIFALDLPTQDMFADNALGMRTTEAGMSRSIFVIAAYLMKRFRWTAKKALQHIQQIRPVAQPNDGFLQQLHIFENANYEANIECIMRHPLYKRWLLSSSSADTG
ncbi:unnamed protein product [Gongylonema pulchrum]|uniref:protein-tyrosine-phosphatase n=1 Tax=Gongylonema pulchrum TaxID=637853 RepID=A0A183D067_9BILA|nr:unnamed protein product [Gongylonema pulchrum]